MSERNLSGKAKMGLCRNGKRVYLVLEFPDEYDAMQMYDVWSMEEITFNFNGPKKLTEIETEAVELRGERE